MSEKPFDFCAKWDTAENRRFLDALKRKKTEFCERNGLPVPAFDKEEDFSVTAEMISQAWGKEKADMTVLCDHRKKHGDCAGGSGFTWPCEAHRPLVATNADRIRKMSDEELVEFLRKPFCNIRTQEECEISYCGICDQCILDWLKEEAQLWK